MSNLTTSRRARSVRRAFCASCTACTACAVAAAVVRAHAWAVAATFTTRTITTTLTIEGVQSGLGIDVVARSTRNKARNIHAVCSHRLARNIMNSRWCLSGNYSVATCQVAEETVTVHTVTSDRMYNVRREC